MMKRKEFKLGACLMAGCVLLSSCVGSFSMFNRLAKWNKKATKYKFLNELIFIVISPAYVFCGLADVLVLNSIEFWTGENPMASNVGKTKKVKGEDGNIYNVKYLAEGYEITGPDGKVYVLTHDSNTDSWWMEVDGEKKELFSFNHDGTVKAALPDGSMMDVAMNEGGLFQLRMAVNGGTSWAFCQQAPTR